MTSSTSSPEANTLVLEDYPRVRFPYSSRVRISKVFTKPSMAKQSFQSESDINTIMARYERTGLLEHQSGGQPQYGDFSQVADYQSALNSIMAAQDAFASLSAKVRRRFNNDPAEFLAFMEDSGNAKEAVALGLAKAPEPTPEPSGAAAPGASDEVRTTENTTAGGGASAPRSGSAQPT